MLLAHPANRNLGHAHVLFSCRSYPPSRFSCPHLLPHVRFSHRHPRAQLISPISPLLPLSVPFDQCNTPTPPTSSAAMARFNTKKRVAGGTGSSNPTSVQHRQRAHSKRRAPLHTHSAKGAQAEKALTVAALAHHTARTNDADTSMDLGPRT